MKLLKVFFGAIALLLLACASASADDCSICQTNCITNNCPEYNACLTGLQNDCADACSIEYFDCVNYHCYADPWCAIDWQNPRYAYWQEWCAVNVLNECVVPCVNDNLVTECSAEMALCANVCMPACSGVCPG
jgi:hypothetical protein